MRCAWRSDTTGIPTGITEVLHSSTELANAIPRAFMDDTDEDRAAIQPVINQIVAYPLSQFDGTMKTIDWSNAPSIEGPKNAGGGETKWVIPEQFFDEFGEVLDGVAPLPGEEAMYAQFRLILDAAQRDPVIKQTLIDTAIETENNVIAPFFEWQHNGRPAGNGWNRSTNNARWGIDYFDRTGTAKSNMFDNKPEETQYFYIDDDSTGRPLDGSSSYEVTFPAGQEPPVNGFWSLTLYNEHHFFHPNPLGRFSLGTKNKNLQRKVARRRQGVQLAPRTRRPLLALYKGLLGQGTHHRRELEAACNCPERLPPRFPAPGAVAMRGRSTVQQNRHCGR